MNHHSVLDQKDPTPEVHWFFGAGGLLGFLGIVPRVKHLAPRAHPTPIERGVVAPAECPPSDNWRSALSAAVSRVPKAMIAAAVALSVLGPVDVQAANVPGQKEGQVPGHVDMTPAEMQSLYQRWQELSQLRYSELSAGLPIAERMKVRDAVVATMKDAAQFAYTGCLARGVAGDKRCRQIFDTSVNAIMDWSR